MTFSRGDTLAIETTALIARALVLENQHLEVAHKALAWLIQQKDPRGTWHSTQATVHAMRALLAGTGPSVEGTMTLQVTVNGRLADTVTITQADADVFRMLDLRRYLQPGENTLSLRAQGRGAVDYQLVATSHVPWTSAPATSKELLTLTVDHGGTAFSVGEILTARVNLRYHGPGAADMTLVDLGLPPGFDPLLEDFERLKTRGLIERFSLTRSQATLYLRKLPAGKPFTFTYRLKARFPLRAKTPPTTAYQYYEPAIRAQARPVELVVKARG